MKFNLCFCGFLLLGQQIIAQSLFVPGGFTSSGIGISNNAGKVGIGTASPSSILTIKGDYGLNIEPASGGSTNFYLTSNSGNNILGVNARTKYGAWDIPDIDKPSSFLDFSTYNVNNPYYGGMAFFTRSSSASGIGTEKMVILNNGNIGIGTISPSSILVIKGDYGLNIEPASGDATNFHITSNSANNIIGVNARTKYGVWNIPDINKPSSFLDFSTYNVNNPYYGGMAFFTRSSSASGIGTEKMVILNNGNIGIGTTTPGSFKLAVNGKIWTQEVNVAMTNPGPDYVFEKDYDLLSLSELETYITQNKHLPEVPSAKEMEANGLNLKEMNLLLLKKVEELTLHLIEKEKQLETLEKRIEQLETKK